MSASTATTLPGHQQFPGNCTLEMALNAIVDIYHRYSIRKGEIDLLDFEEFNTLLNEQAPTFLAACVSAMGEGISWGAPRDAVVGAGCPHPPGVVVHQARLVRWGGCSSCPLVQGC